MHKAASTDDKRLQATLKRLGVNTIPGIEEVDIFQGDSVIHFVNPKGARMAWRLHGGCMGLHGGGGVGCCAPGFPCGVSRRQCQLCAY